MSLQELVQVKYAEAVNRGQQYSHGRQAEGNKILPNWRSSLSLQGLVQLKYAEAVNHGQQYLRGEAFEFAATLVKDSLSYSCTSHCVCVIINCSTSNRG